MADDDHPHRETWFSPLPGEYQAQLDELIALFGYARIHAALIRKMPKDLGTRPLQPLSLEDLGL